MGLFCLPKSNKKEDLIVNALANIKLWQREKSHGNELDYLIDMAIGDLKAAKENKNN